MTVSTVLALHAFTTLVQDYYKDAGGTIQGKESVRPHGWGRWNCAWSNDRESSLEQRPRKCREHIFQKKSRHDASIDQTSLIY